MAQERVFFKQAAKLPSISSKKIVSGGLYATLETEMFVFGIGFANSTNTAPLKTRQFLEKSDLSVGASEQR